MSTVFEVNIWNCSYEIFHSIISFERVYSFSFSTITFFSSPLCRSCHLDRLHGHRCPAHLWHTEGEEKTGEMVNWSVGELVS